MVHTNISHQTPYLAPAHRYARNLEALAELYVHMGAGIGGVKHGRNFHFQVIRGRGGAGTEE
jgi:hypothetical protein